MNFKIWKHRTASIWIGHNSSTAVNESSFEKTLKNIPNWLHEFSVHCFVVILKIDPPSESSDYLLPFARIPHHNSATSIIIIGNPHIYSLFLICYFEFLIDLIFNRKPMTIPAKSALNVVSSHRGIPTHHIFDCSCGYMTVVRGSCCKRRAIIECIRWKMPGLS